MSDRAKFRLFDTLLSVMVTALLGVSVWACSSIISMGESRAKNEHRLDALEAADSGAVTDAELMRLKVEILTSMQETPRWVEEKFNQIIQQQSEMRTDIREMKNRLDKSTR